MSQMALATMMFALMAVRAGTAPAQREAYGSTVDCMTAAFTQRLPLDVCQ